MHQVITQQCPSLRRTLPTSSPSARQTPHSDDPCAQRRFVQPSLNVRALNWDDVHSLSVVRTFGTVCHHLYAT